MVEKARISCSIFIKAALIIGVIIIAAIALGIAMDSFRNSFINEEMIAANIETESFLTSQAYLANHTDYCRLTEGYIDKLSTRVEQIGMDLGNLGSKMVFINRTFLDRRYFIYEMRLWMLMEDYKQRCDPSINTVLFFYNDEGDENYVQGLVLTAAKKELENNLMVFSFKHSFDEPALSLLETNYGITRAPSLVINGKVYSRLIEKEELERILG
jgi:hypothetical protein